MRKLLTLATLSLSIFLATQAYAEAIRNCARDPESRDVLALSGGGYRAMLFHVGALWRLNQIGCLKELEVISSVSGGSIVAGVLASRWGRLTFDGDGVATNFEQEIAKPLMDFAATTTVLNSTKFLVNFVTFQPSSRPLESTYAVLFKDKRLQDLPDKPEFIFNAVNMQTGQPWTFSKFRVGDPTLGYTSSEDISIASAVSASSAYPPVLSPHRLNLANAQWHEEPTEPLPPDMKVEDFRKTVLLADGGVVDNLGLESLWESRATIFVSDGGGRVQPVADLSPGLRTQAMRVIALVHGQHDVLRTRLLMDRFNRSRDRSKSESGSRTDFLDGVMWRIHSAACHHDVKFPVAEYAEIAGLSSTPTELSKLKRRTIRRLVNWGYIAADRSLPYLDRAWPHLNYQWSLAPNQAQPYPKVAVALRAYQGCAK